MIINNLEFAQKQQKLDDQFAITTLKRLAQTLSLESHNASQNSIYFELVGETERFRQPSLRLRIKTNLPVICQRCLDQMLIPMDLNLQYLISDVAIESLDDSDDIDWVEADKEMDLYKLIEDELLLAMPIAPTHENNCAKVSMQSGEKPNPFAVLQGKFK